MRKQMQRWMFLAGCTIPSLFAGEIAFGATPTAEQALGLTPIQKDVDYDKPAAADIAKCSVEVSAQGKASGWIVRGPSGETLRRFFDTNSDNKVDLWCYYKDGIEIYRDVDANFNNKADQYRWLGTAGTRWGLDTNEDGRIDEWKVISPEEVSAEIVAAVRDNDAQRFTAVMLTAKEADELALGKEETAEIKKDSADAVTTFRDAVKAQKIVTPKSTWISFGATRPGTIPAGTNGSTADIRVYENVSAMVETEGKHSQLIVGTLIQVGDTWKAIALPSNIGTDVAAAAPTRFFNASTAPRNVEGPMTAGAINEKTQELVASLQKIDKGLETARTAAQFTKLNMERAELVEQIIADVTDPGDRLMWIKQYSESVSMACLGGQFPDGLQRLEKLLATVEERDIPAEIAAVKFPYLKTKFNIESQKENAPFGQLQGKYIDDLEAYCNKFVSAEEAPDVMLELAMTYEFAENQAKAVEWYGKLVDNHPNHPSAKKAAGSRRRLNCLGQPITLKGTTTDRKAFDLAAFKGKVVLVQYWATWCEPCKQDMDTIKQLQAKYAKAGFQPVGVNLDADAASVAAFLKSKPLTWPSLYEEGGLESRLGNEMGILTLPTMILIDKNGKVVRNNISAAELDKELGKLLK